MAKTAVTSLAPDQIVLSANLQADSYYTTALQNIPQGSELTLTVSANDGWEDVEYAIGALYCLAENGAVVPNLAAGSNPRTAVGQKADGTLIFYTIDGRKTGHSIGASLTQVGERLLELGCQTVLCLDGGGSTNLAVTTPDSTTATIINRPSETGRKVTNQVFLVASDRSSGRLDHFYVNAAGDYVLAGSAVSVTASGVDSNYIPMDASYTLSASAGSIAEQEDGRYLLTTPASGGDITVTASGRGAKGSTVVHAIRNPDNLTLKNGASNLTELTVTPGSKTALTAGAVWNHLPLTATNEAFTWSVSGDIGTVDEHGVFTASAPGTVPACMPAGLYAGAAISADASETAGAASPARGRGECGLRLRLRGRDAGRFGAAVRPASCPACGLQPVRIFYAQFCPRHILKLPGHGDDRLRQSHRTACGRVCQHQALYM